MKFFEVLRFYARRFLLARAAQLLFDSQVFHLQSSSLTSIAVGFQSHRSIVAALSLPILDSANLSMPQLQTSLSGKFWSRSEFRKFGESQHMAKALAA